MALCEFGCSNLEQVYDMTWAEFRIRQYGYNRMQKDEWFKLREIAYASIIGPHLDPKKVPPKDKYMPLSEEKSGVSDRMKARMREAINKYKKETNG
jgi:hypothetical protein